MTQFPEIDNDEYSGGLRGSAAEILTLAEARGRHARAIKMMLTTNDLNEASQKFMEQIRELAVQARSHQQQAQGGRVCPIILQVQHGQQICDVRLGSAYSCEPSDQTIAALKRVFGDQAVSVVYE